jgi:hypothetical protein
MSGAWPPDGRRGESPSVLSSAVLLTGCAAATASTFVEAAPSVMAARISWIWLGAMALSLMLEARGGIRSLLRADLIAMAALYFLLYFEFLFPQTHFDTLVLPQEAGEAGRLTQVGLAAMVIGRHVALPCGWLARSARISLGPGHYLALFWVAFLLSHLPMWVAVGFDIRALWEELLGPRFGRSWGRGRYGDMGTLFHELQLFGYIVPPVAGWILASRRRYRAATLWLMGICLTFHLTVAFCSGTRNVLAIHFATLWAGYVLSVPRVRPVAMALGSTVLVAIFLTLSVVMLQFREHGLREWLTLTLNSPGWMQSAFFGAAEASEERSGFLVDYNLWRLAQMQSAFPEVHPHLGWNVIFVALTKPVPRALWLEKPRGLKVELESVIGAEGYTIACTWIGEAHVAGGALWVGVVGIGIGLFCRLWNTLASNRTGFALILFASGVYAVLMLMRSLMFFTTALLPCLALLLMGTAFRAMGFPSTTKI